MSAETLDFLVIGAAKSGTTSLFRYLSAHPRIYMPAAKEIAFFSSDRDYPKGADWYLSEWFAGARAGDICGEASPQYMFESGVAARIHAYFPGVKLIATVRDPIARTFSHYRHSRRLGTVRESSFSDFLDLAIGPDATRRVPGYRNIVGYGEYGRILAEYLERFPREHVRVVFFEHLSEDAQATAAGLYAWLGARGAVDARVFQRTHNRGGNIRFPRLGRLARRALDAAYAREWLRAAAIRVVTRDRLRSFYWWVRGEFNIEPVRVKVDARGGDGAVMSPDDRARLRDHFAEDVARLEELLGRSVPWQAFHE